MSLQYQRQRKYMQTSEKYRLYRTEYDKKRLAKIRQKHAEIVEKLGGVCYVCREARKGLRLHHIAYPEGYKEPHSAHAQWKFLLEVEKNPENFRLLCVWCHAVVTKIINNLEMLERLTTM